MTIIHPDAPFPRPFPQGAVLLIDKPLGWTSFDAVNKVRYHLSKLVGVKRIKLGHAGTLDPLATGLLILCAGDYTKRIDEFQQLPKTYEGTITFGATTPSYDREKAVDTVFSTAEVNDEALQALIPRFSGAIEQLPPVFSAVRVKGKRLYENARSGTEVDIQARSVFIESLEIGPLRPVDASIREVLILSDKGTTIYQHPEHPEGLQADFKVRCSKGTYIRSLAYDLGEALHSGAYLSSLRRTETGGLSVEDAWEIEALMQAVVSPH
ncbi:MAG: tRNA pseudouridine(55) synthase TruB [Saprospiraceae bacterium]